ncbi:GTPase Era [Thermoflexibacter ruber]|uniref:GTPase Era n=1 Tax=Thermoflexibacter ruber TaxID=1003 RepID=A0A1I2H0Q1_9BACT|nr:GTPase Era [Thermoflexibacter ruber]SFF23232.1 GTP-binding protein Era [Thermoflexibacter ruber]
MEKVHKAGFVNIIGKPNVGKSTLMNVMVGEKLSIITSKAQTTRHRIMGILNGEDFQIVYSDTPGIINPHYELHRAMMQFVNVSLEDADVILFVTDIFEKYDEEDVLKKLKTISAPILLLINKVDLAKQEQVEEKIAYWAEVLNAKEIIPISALNNYNIEKVFDKILEKLPAHPPYYPKDELTDRSERFFAAEIIREKIFMNYTKEIPYSCEVIVTSFKEEESIIRISAEILVERPTQKSIVIGKGGEKLKKVGTEARKDLEEFFQKKIFLEQHVKVEPDWRNKKNKLVSLGYIQT